MPSPTTQEKTMMKISMAALVLGVIFNGCALAQQSPATNGSIASDQDVQLLRKDLRSARKQIVAANMLLSESEAQKFWPVYDEYTVEVTKINDKKLAIIEEYAANYQNLSDDKAHSLVEQWAQADDSALKSREKYFPQVEKAISSKKAARFFQIDRRIALLVDLQVASEIPLVEPEELKAH
jgi:PBP1b-binding outer membrane lipoprotein LpoB